MATPFRTDRPRYHYTEAEFTAAHEEWGCNCGPGALAMLLRLKPTDVRDHIPDFAARRYTNPTMMKAALTSLKVPFRPGPRRFSSYGLCRIQWGGPWVKLGVTPGHPVIVGKWGYRFSHWIGSMGDGANGDVFLFDINGGWMRPEKWAKEIVPLLAEGYARADGRYYITHNLELDLPGFQPIPAHVQPTYGICRICGCTDTDCRQCIAKTGEACHWIDDSHTLCSACRTT